MKLRRNHPPAISGAKAGFSAASAYPLENDPRLPSQRQVRRERRRPDPLADVWDREVVPLLNAAPGLRPIAVFEELQRQHSELGAGRGAGWNAVFRPGGQSTRRTDAAAADRGDRVPEQGRGL